MTARATISIDKATVLDLLPHLQRGSSEAAMKMAEMIQRFLDEESAVDTALAQAQPERIYRLAQTVQAGYQRFRLLAWIQGYEERL